MNLRDLVEADSVLSEKSRIAIMALLAASDGVDFMTLMNATELTRGNLASPLKKLEAAHYISVVKEFVDRKPRTTLKATPLGRTRFEATLKAIESMLQWVQANKRS